MSATVVAFPVMQSEPTKTALWHQDIRHVRIFGEYAYYIAPLVSEGPLPEEHRSAMQRVADILAGIKKEGETA